MSNPVPPKPEPLHKNPQVVVTVIGGIITLIAAVVGVLPALLNNHAPTPQPTLVIIIAPQAQQTATNLVPIETLIMSVTNTPGTLPTAQVAAINTTEPPTSLPIATEVASVPSVPTAVPNVLLLYDDVSFTLLNQTSGKLSLEGITFHSTSGDWDARKWGPSIYNSLPAAMCLRLRNAAVGSRQPPAPCSNKIYGLIEVGSTALFWLGVDSFDVLRNGQVIATCLAANQTCPIAVT